MRLAKYDISGLFGFSAMLNYLKFSFVISSGAVRETASRVGQIVVEPQFVQYGYAKLRWLCVLCIFMVGAALSGCTHQYAQSVTASSLSSIKLSNHYQLIRKEPWVVASNTKIVIAKTQPKYAKSDAFDYVNTAINEEQWLEANQSLSPRLNSALFRSLQHSLLARFGSVDVVDGSSTALALELAQARGGQLLIIPSALASSDLLNSQLELNQGRTATSRTIGVDTSIIRIAVFEVTTGKLVDLATVEARGRYFASSNESTVTLAEKAAQVYVQAIAGGQL